MKKIFFILLLSSTAWATCPLNQDRSPQVNQENQNMCQQIANPSINVGTASTMTITNLIVSKSVSGAIQSTSAFTNWVAYTPTFTGFGSVNSFCFWRRVGDMLQIRAYWTNGTVAASAASITIPSGLAIDTSKISTASNTAQAGTWFALTGSFGTSNDIGAVFSDGATTTKLFMAFKGNGTTAFSQALGSDIGTSSDGMSLMAEIPISGWSF